MAGRLPTSASIAQRGHGARPGHLPGPLCTEAQARPRGKPGPGAVAARLQALASRGPGAEAAAEGRPHPGTRVRPAPEPTDPEAAGGARAGPRRPWSSRSVCASVPVPPQELSAPGWAVPCASREAPMLPSHPIALVLIALPLHLRPRGWSAHVRGAQVQGSGYPSGGRGRGGPDPNRSQEDNVSGPACSKGL